jgi:hypothetical protein
MDHKKAYEQTIASKLEALPLLNMADAIWSRIETQLDMDMPADDGGGNEPGSPSGGSRLRRTGLFVFLAAFVTIFLLYKNNKKAEPLFQPNHTTQPTQSSLPTVQSNKTNSEGRNDETSLPQTRSGDPLIENRVDSASNIPVSVSPSPTDSVQQVMDVPPPSLPVNDTAPTKKKMRGVTGITDNDYRIVPAKKDST